jgi:heat shock protein HslJ
MKPLYFLLFSFLLSTYAYSQVKAGTIVRPKKVVETTDEVEYYEVEVASNQRSYLNLLKGSWNITSMRRQPKVDAELLTNATLTISGDSTFAGNTGCNSISGKFTLKGTGIRFGTVASTKKACSNMDQETAFLRLLQQTISNYSVTNDTLLLRDVTGNVVFEAKRN